MIAGNIGSSSIMSYTVIGDNVNLGSRLESLNKDYRTRIIISDATRGRLKGAYEIAPLGDVVVKGKTRPVAIFEVKGTVAAWRRVSEEATDMKHAMKHAAFALAFCDSPHPAYAQLGGLTKRIGQAKDAKDAYDVLNMSEKDERQLGEQVSALVRKEFGVLQDAAVTKYVTLVGTVLAQASTRPDLQWEFIVLDTDGVNAFAAPGGIVHITRGALGLIKSEAELAGVLGHELAHVTKKHTDQRDQEEQELQDWRRDVAPGSNAFFDALAGAAYDNIVEKGFDRGDEEDCGPGGRSAGEQGRIRTERPGDLSWKTRRAQQEHANPQRAVRVAPGDPGTDRENRQPGEVREAGGRRDGPATLRVSDQVRSEACQRSRDGHRRHARGRRRRRRKRRKRSRPKKRRRKDSASAAWGCRQASRLNRRRHPHRQAAAQSAPTVMPRAATTRTS